METEQKSKVTRLADFSIPMLRKASMIPQTVPNSPIKGVTLPVVARKFIIFSIREISRLEALTRARLMLSRCSGFNPGLLDLV